MPETKITDELVTIRDYWRYAISSFSAAKLSFGHGTTTATDDAAFLVLDSLDLPIDTLDPFLDARLTTAERAYAVGAVMAVTEDLDAEVAGLVDGLLSASGVTMRATKAQLFARAEVLEAPPAFDPAMLGEIYTGPDFTEGVRAFLAKEKPAFGR